MLFDRSSCALSPLVGGFMKLFTVLLLLGAGMPSAAALSQVIQDEQAPKVTDLEGGDLYRARHILRQFFAKEKHPECYKVLFSDFQGNLRVDFWPKDRDPVIYAEEDQPPAARPSCGRNVGYVLDRRGAILRRIYSR
jgi:hypothetical protein